MERVVLSGLLSAKAEFRLLVDGEWGTKEADRVLDILNVIIKHAKEDQDAGLPTADDVRGLFVETK